VGASNGAHILGTLVLGEEPSTASKADISASDLAANQGSLKLRSIVALAAFGLDELRSNDLAVSRTHECANRLASRPSADLLYSRTLTKIIAIRVKRK
jgi:hypothetical protein